MVRNDPIIDEMVERLVRSFNPLKIILFGSRARGDARPDSDVDLLVVMPEGTDRHLAAVSMLDRLADAALPKDILVTTPAEITARSHSVGSVLRPALREGKVLHERR
jgi:uncharacterized protein